MKLFRMNVEEGPFINRKHRSSLLRRKMDFGQELIDTINQYRKTEFLKEEIIKVYMKRNNSWMTIYESFNRKKDGKD